MIVRQSVNIRIFAILLSLMFIVGVSVFLLTDDILFFMTVIVGCLILVLVWDLFIRDRQELQLEAEGLQQNIKEQIGELTHAQLRAQRLEYLVDHSTEGIVVFDPSDDFRVQYVNPAWLQLIGATEQGVLGEPEDLVRRSAAMDVNIQAMFDQALRNRMESRMDIEWRRFDGVQRVIEVLLEPMKDPETGKLVWVEKIRDMTDERLAQKEMVDEKVKYEELLKNLPIGVVRSIPGPNGRIVEINTAAMQILGFASREQALAFNVAQLYENADTRNVLTAKLMTQGFVAGTEVQMQQVNGKKFWAYITARLKTGEDGKMYLDGTIQDISERKEAQQQILNEKQRFEGFVDRLPIAVFRSDARPGGKFLAFNEAGIKMFEAASKEEVMQHSVEDVYEKPEMRVEFGKALTEKGLVKDVVLPLKTLRGRPLWGAVTATLTKTADGVFIDGVAVDITDRLKSEKKIKELNELRNRFIHVISHQLRTPLSAIRWNLEALLGDELGKLQKSQREFIQLTYEAEMRLIGRLNDMLTAMDIEEGRMLLMRDHTTLDRVVLPTIVDAESKCSAKKIRLSKEMLAPMSLELVVDVEKIHEALSQLMENAIDYTPENGSIRLRILTPSPDILRCEVIDTGVGIPKEEQVHLFQPFYRASNASIMRPDASGLGLSITKYYIEQHGGRVGYMSEQGKGSTFWFEIPIDHHS